MDARTIGPPGHAPVRAPLQGAALLWPGLAFLACALLLDFLWMARHPTDEGGMSFAASRLGLRAELSRAQYEPFALASVLAGAGAVVVAWALAGRAIRSGRGSHEPRATRLEPARRSPLAARGFPVWRWVLAFGLLLVCALPLHHVVIWATGGVSLFRAYDAAWGRVRLFRELGLLVSSQLFWLAGVLAAGGYLLVAGRGGPSGAAARALERLARLPRAGLVGAAGLLVVVLAAAFSLRVFLGQPHLLDATMYFFQAKSFAAGRLWSPLPGGAEFFDPGLCGLPGPSSYVFLGDRWLAIGLPGAPLLYALGILVGCPWIIGPLLGGAVVVMTYMLTKELFGPSAALVALPLAALSPWLIFMSGEYLTHVPCALVAVVFLLAALRAMERASWPLAAVAGLFLGLGVHFRPVTALALCLPTAVAWLAWLARRPGAAWRPTLAFGVALAAPLAAVFAYNAATTGSATTFAYQLSWKAHEAAGIGGHYVAGWRWRPINGLSNFLEMLYTFNSGMFGWPVPALGLVLGALIVVGLGERSARRGPVLAALSALCLALAYVGWQDVPECLGGPRYLFEALPLMVALTAGLLHAAWQKLVAEGIDARRASGALLLAVVFFFAHAGVRTAARGPSQFRQASCVDVRMFDVVRAQAERPALVFVPVPGKVRYLLKFYAAVAQNDPALAGPILYAHDLGDRNRKLIAALPGRHYYRWDYEKFAIEPLGLGISE